MTRILAVWPLVFLVAWAAWQSGQARHARAEVTRLSAELATAEAARAWATRSDAVHRAHLDRLARERLATQKQAQKLAELEGQDEPLSDLLRAASGSLWP